MAQQLRKTYQLKITLMGTKPPIWRRVLVSDSTPLNDLHDIFQIVMGWTDSHLHQFIVGQRRYGEPDPEWDDDMLDESIVRLKSILKKEKDSLIYEYDFGDGWAHRVVLEKKLDYDQSKILPFCVTGRRGCPPEDVGGIWGYERFLEVYNNKQHPEHLEMLEWAGEYFQPEQLDVDEINQIFNEPQR